MAKSKNGKKIDCKYCLRSFYPKGLLAHEKKCKSEHENPAKEETNEFYDIESKDLTVIVLCNGENHQGFLLDGSKVHLIVLNA